MTKVKSAVMAALSVVFIILAYGRPLEIREMFSPVLWLVPIGVMIFCIKSCKKFPRAVFVFLLTIYIAESGLFYFREYFGTTEISDVIDGNKRTVVSYHDPGVMGGSFYTETEYYCIIRSEALTVQIFKSRKNIGNSEEFSSPL